jgi:predicted MFS family arabinose efflux permease
VTQLLRSRSGALLGALMISSIATGVMFIAIPLELRSLHASPRDIGITLSMFGLGTFLFEWVWGLIADRAGYAAPLIVSELLYAAGVFWISRSMTVPLIAVSYLVTSGMLVSVGPIGRSFLGTTLPPHLRATGLAVLSAEWLIGDALGAGAGGALIERMPIASVLAAAAVLPLLTAVLLVLVFRGYRQSLGHEIETGPTEGNGGRGWVRVLLVTAAIMILFQIGFTGETAFLPLLVTAHLNLSAADAGTALFAAGIFGGLLLVPGGIAADRWGRRAAMVAGCLASAAGFVIYAVAPRPGDGRLRRVRKPWRLPGAGARRNRLVHRRHPGRIRGLRGGGGAGGGGGCCRGATDPDAAKIGCGRLMGDQSQEHAGAWLLSQYRTRRASDGRLVIANASPLGPILGCAVPAAFGALVTLMFRAAGASALLVLFAVVVIGVLAFNGSRIWICGQGTIQTARSFWGARVFAGAPHTTRSVILHRDLWRTDAGSTDTVFVNVQPDHRLKILSVHNWVGRESRVASGGMGSLARSGPVVLSAPSPLRPWANDTLLPAVSEAVSELAGILQRELGVPVLYECEQIGARPRGR